MRIGPALAGLALAASVLACDKDKEKKDGPPSPIPASAPQGSAPPVAATSAADMAVRLSFEGKYTAAAGSLYVPDAADYAGFKFRGEDASIALGEGTLSVTIDPASGVVTGTGDGALGPIVLSGSRSGDVLTFSFWRKDPADQGASGTGQGTVSGNTIEGTLRAAAGTANVIREATFTLSKK